MEGDVVVLQDIYTFDFGVGIDEDGRFRGTLKQHRHPAVVLRERSTDYGIALEPSLFATRSRPRTRSGRR